MPDKIHLWERIQSYRFPTKYLNPIVTDGITFVLHEQQITLINCWNKSV